MTRFIFAKNNHRRRLTINIVIELGTLQLFCFVPALTRQICRAFVPSTNVKIWVYKCEVRKYSPQRFIFAPITMVRVDATKNFFFLLVPRVPSPCTIPGFFYFFFNIWQDAGNLLVPPWLSGTVLRCHLDYYLSELGTRQNCSDNLTLF